MRKRAPYRPDANGERVKRLRVALLALPAALLAACGGGIPPAQNYATVQGRAYDASTNQPVAGVVVTVDVIRTATTGADGTYKIGSLPVGQCTMTASAPSGYALTTTPDCGSVTAGQLVTIDIPLRHS